VALDGSDIMKVFISSTVYDLIDIRAELCIMFKEMGIDPILSDANDSAFEIFTDKNTIETCLINLSKSDYVIIILSQRYGSSLSKFGYGDFSTTHLEYLKAIETHKPIFMYVRDRLEADYKIWNMAKEKDQISYVWVSQKDIKLFDLLSRHSKLSQKRSNTNWYKTFKDSIELKEIIKSDFKYKAAKRHIKNLLSDNKFPLLVPDLNVDTDAIRTHSKLIFKVKIKNAGGAPAFNYVPKWLGANSGYFKESDTKEVVSIIAPGDETILTAIYQLGPGYVGTTIELSLSYSNADGYQVTEIYDVKARVIADPNISVLSGCILKTRKFELGKPFEITIEGQV